MIVFKAKIYSNKDRISLETSLKQRMLTAKKYSNHIFPFCLFSKTFYFDLKESRKILFEGKIINGEFELFQTSKIYSTRTWLPMKIKVCIRNNEISYKNFIPNYILLLILVLILTDLFFDIDLQNFDNTLFLIAGLFCISYFIKIIRIQFSFRKLFIQ